MARINACASDGEIVVSEGVWRNIKNQTEFRSVYLGNRSLKNVDHHVKLYRMLLDEEKKSIQLKALYHTYTKRVKYGIASLYCGLVEIDNAIEQLEEAFLIHDMWIGHLIFTRFSDPIRDDPRYISLMKHSLFR